MAIDFLAGFFDFDIDTGSKKKLGVFGKALEAGVKREGGDDNLPLPTMEKPERVSKISNPTIAAISRQLDTLVKTANKIGVYTKEQQDALLNQIKQSKRVAKEQQLEQKVPVVPEQPDAGATGDSLLPIDSTVEKLIEKVDELSETIDDINRGGGRGGVTTGPSLLGGGPTKGPKPGGKVTSVKVDGQALKLNKAGQWVDAATSRFVSKPVQEAAAAAAASRGNIVRRAAASIASTASSSKIADVMRLGFRSGAVEAGSKKAAIRAAAGPIIRKALGKTALKSIPLIGAAAGVGFAISRLLQGDVVGAGLDLASGLGGPLTAIPAFAATVARDSYASVYGVQPEQDPNFNKNYPELKKTIEDMMREQLQQVVQPKKTPTDQEIGDAETPKAAPQAAPAKQPPAIPAPAGPSTGGDADGGGGAPAGAASTGGGGAAAAAATTTGGGGAASTPAPTPEAPAAATGQAITQATEEATAAAAGGIYSSSSPVDQSWAQSFGYNPQAKTFMPQSTGAPRDGRQGIGNIPSPVYDSPYIENLKKTLFFDY